MRTLLVDLASAARGLARSPWTATLAAATLAVGLGASVALFAVAGPLVLDPTPHPEADRIVVPVAPVFRALALGVGLVLLLTCVTVANLLLARALRRDAELSVRAALGAGRRRLVGLFLAEGLWVGVLGGTLGLLVASWGLAGLRALAPRALPRLAEVGLEPHALGLALGLAVLAGLAAAAAPAWYATRADAGPGSGARTGRS